MRKHGWMQPYLLMNVVALDHKNRIARESMRQWQTSVRRWYSSNSKRTHIAVAPPSTPAEIFLFLHRTTSAAANENDEGNLKTKAIL